MATKPKANVDKAAKTVKTSAKNVAKVAKKTVAEVKTKVRANAASKTSRVKTVDNDDLTVVVKETVFGLASKYALVRHYGTTTGEETLMTSLPSFDREETVSKARELSKKLNVMIVVEDVE